MKLPQQEALTKWLDSPPRWFCILFWCYPITLALPTTPILLKLKDLGASAKTLCLLWFALAYTPPILCIIHSRWFRNRLISLLPVWWIILCTVFGMTQGALTCAISKAFSAVGGP